MTHQEIEALVARRDLALNRRDLAALASLHADSCVLHSPMAGTVTGPIAIAEVWETLFNAFPDLVITSEPPVIDGDRVSQAAMLAGTHTGDFMGLPATGKHAQLPVVTLFTVKDHQFVQVRPVYDFTGLLVQIGVLKARPA
jgi:steroid delta-isomerase-like uncharacterized protein